MAGLGGNDPHSSAVTVPCASMNTLDPYWYERRDSNPYALRREILSLLSIPFLHSRVYFGGLGWSRTNIVFPEGTGLQPADAHAIASTNPVILKSNYNKT